MNLIFKQPMQMSMLLLEYLQMKFMIIIVKIFSSLKASLMRHRAIAILSFMRITIPAAIKRIVNSVTKFSMEYKP